MILPEGPEPLTPERFKLFSDAIFLAKGEAITLSEEEEQVDALEVGEATKIKNVRWHLHQV